MSKTRRIIPIRGRKSIRLCCDVKFGFFSKRRTYLIEDDSGHPYASKTDGEEIKIYERALRTFGEAPMDTDFLRTWLAEFISEYEKKRPRQEKKDKHWRPRF